MDFCAPVYKDGVVSFVKLKLTIAVRFPVSMVEHAILNSTDTIVLVHRATVVSFVKPISMNVLHLHVSMVELVWME
jgi:hypothetical protein